MDTVLSFSVDRDDFLKSFDSANEFTEDEFRSHHATDVYLDAVDAIDYDIICEQF